MGRKLGPSSLPGPSCCHGGLFQGTLCRRQLEVRARVPISTKPPSEDTCLRPPESSCRRRRGREGGEAGEETTVPSDARSAPSCSPRDGPGKWMQGRGLYWARGRAGPRERGQGLRSSGGGRPEEPGTGEAPLSRQGSVSRVVSAAACGHAHIAHACADMCMQGYIRAAELGPGGGDQDK